MTNTAKHIEVLEQLHAATFSFGRDATGEGRKDLREALQAAIEALSEKYKDERN